MIFFLFLSLSSWAITPEELRESVIKNFPLIQEAEFKREAADARILEAISAPEPADVLRALAGETASIITLARMAHDQDKAGRRALREENDAVSRGDIDPFGPEAGNLETLL